MKNKKILRILAEIKDDASNVVKDKTNSIEIDLIAQGRHMMACAILGRFEDEIINEKKYRK